MALSQEQKTQLVLMVDSPKDFLQKCKDKLIYLPGFKNEFFKDGSGIFHVLAECIVDKKDIVYSEIMNHILSRNNHLDLFQKTGRKESAFEILIKDNPPPSLCNHISEFLSYTKVITQERKYNIMKFIGFLAKNNQLDNVSNMLNKFDTLATDSTLIKSLFEVSIDTKNSKLIDYLFQNKKIMEICNDNIGKYKFNVGKDYSPKYVNIYAFATNRNAKNELFKLMDKFGSKVNFDGNINLTDSAIYSSANHSLDYILDNKNRDIIEIENKDFFENLYLKIPIENRALWLSEHKINKVFNKNYHQVVFDDIPVLLSSDKIKDINKWKIFNQLMYISHYNGDKSIKFKMIEKITEPLWEMLPKVKSIESYLATKCLFNNLSGKDVLDESEMVSFVNIFKNIKKYNLLEYVPKIFGEFFFNQPKLAKKLIEAGLNVGKLPKYNITGNYQEDMYFNVFELFIVLVNNNKMYGGPTLGNGINIEAAKETLSLLYENNKDLVFYELFYKDKLNSSNDSVVTLLDYAISEKSREIFDLLTVEDFRNFKKINELSPLRFIKSGHYTDEIKDSFSICVDKMLSADFSFTQKLNLSYINEPTYYYLMDNISNIDVLNRVLEKENIDLNVTAKDINFWINIKAENSIELLKSKMTEPLNSSETRNILRTLSSTNTFLPNLLNFIKVFPESIYCKLNDGENILHNAIKSNANELATKISEMYPNLCIEANEQNKMPVSYLLPKFVRVINKGEKFSVKKELEKNKTLFYALINTGLFSENKKANDILEKQFIKYKIIEDTFPDLIKEYRYQRLNMELPKTNLTHIKKNKI